MKSDKKTKTKIAEIFTHYVDGKRFLQKCVRPSKKEFVAMMKAHIAGVLFLGVMGYVIKLVHIPINNIIVGKSK